jgi:hypothetical protein
MGRKGSWSVVPGLRDPLARLYIVHGRDITEQKSGG